MGLTHLDAGVVIGLLDADDAHHAAATDATWQSGLTPILKSGIYFGESYDARAESGVVTGGATVLADRRAAPRAPSPQGAAHGRRRDLPGRRVPAAVRSIASPFAPLSVVREGAHRPAP